MESCDDILRQVKAAGWNVRHHHQVRMNIDYNGGMCARYAPSNASVNRLLMFCLLIMVVIRPRMHLLVCLWLLMSCFDIFIGC